MQETNKAAQKSFVFIVSCSGFVLLKGVVAVRAMVDPLS
jgi:hypothetical protein